MPVNSEPVYYQLLLQGGSPALSAPLGPNPGGDLVNATPDRTSDRQLWELVVSLTKEANEFWVAMRNKYTGFVAAAPVDDNTSGVTQEGFDRGTASPGLLWTFAPGPGGGWAIRPAFRQNQNLNTMHAGLGGEVGIRSVDSGHPLEVWWAVADVDGPEGRH